MPDNTPKPPYVQFEVRSVEDRTKSVEAGHYVPKDVIYALVTPQGTKERLEKVAEDWLASIEEGVKQDRIPPEWLDYYRRRFDDFKNSRETPETGTSIRDWPALSPAQCRLFLDLNIRTVEEVAAMSEEACSRIGMGARALKAKAQAWLDTSVDTGKIAGELEVLRQRNAELEERDREREERLAALERQLSTLAPAVQQVDEEDSITEDAED